MTRRKRGTEESKRHIPVHQRCNGKGAREMGGSSVTYTHRVSDLRISTRQEKRKVARNKRSDGSRSRIFVADQLMVVDRSSLVHHMLPAVW